MLKGAAFDVEFVYVRDSSSLLVLVPKIGCYPEERDRRVQRVCVMGKSSMAGGVAWG